MRIAIIAALLAAVIVVWPQAAQARVYGLAPRIVIIDPGHGGRDSGAVFAGVEEAPVNVAVGKALARELGRAGITAVLTRKGPAGVLPADVRYAVRSREEMKERVRRARQVPFDAFLSLHCNAWAAGGARGAQVFVDPGALDTSAALGSSITAAFHQGLPHARPLSRKINHFLLKRLQDRTAVTVEMGFLSDGDERARLTSAAYQRRLARVITMGLVRYFTDVGGREAAAQRLLE